MRKDFSRSVKTTPALKGVAEYFPSGNIKGDFKANLRFEKSYLGR